MRRAMLEQALLLGSHATAAGLGCAANPWSSCSSAAPVCARMHVLAHPGPGRPTWALSAVRAQAGGWFYRSFPTGTVAACSGAGSFCSSSAACSRTGGGNKRCISGTCSGSQRNSRGVYIGDRSVRSCKGTCRSVSVSDEAHLSGLGTLHRQRTLTGLPPVASEKAALPHTTLAGSVAYIHMSGRAGSHAITRRSVTSTLSLSKPVGSSPSSSGSRIYGSGSTDGKEEIGGSGGGGGGDGSNGGRGARLTGSATGSRNASGWNGLLAVLDDARQQGVEGRGRRQGVVSRALPPRLAPTSTANDWGRLLARPTEYWDHR